MTRRTGILLLNLGTPDSPAVKDVRKYLKEFLNDPRVIDLPWLKRKILVNLIIVPLRAPKSAKEYAKLFKHGNGNSPLLSNGLGLQKEVQNLLHAVPQLYKIREEYNFREKGSDALGSRKNRRRVRPRGYPAGSAREGAVRG